MEKINLTAKQIEHVMNCFCHSSTCHQKDNTNYDDCPCKCYYARALLIELVGKEKVTKCLIDTTQKIIDCAVSGGLNKNYHYDEYSFTDCMSPTMQESKYLHTLTEKEIKEISDRISEKVGKEIERQFEEIKNKE